MKLELHLLQNFPPSCLNRDDTNSPKDCEFGGVRRARISSQSLKRSIRQDFVQHHRVPAESLAVRTKRLVERVADLVQQQSKRDREEVENVVEQLLASAGLEVTKKEGADTKTQYLLFLPSRNVEGLAQLVVKNWAELSKAFPAEKAEKGSDDGKKEKAKDKKKQKSAGASAALGDELTAEVRKLVFEANRTPELALFGRMIADKPEHNVDAACQVAHAISTHRVSMEFDFYTAVDDLKPRGDSGADMMGTIQFNSACFYRYSVVDLDQLARTLAGLEPTQKPSAAEKKAAVEAAKAWLLSSVSAIPSARQNGFAAFTPPQLVLTASRSTGNPLSLANAFVTPVRPGNQPGEDLVSQSAKALAAHLGELTSLYGSQGAQFRLATRKELAFDVAGTRHEASFDALVKAVESDLSAWEKAT